MKLVLKWYKKICNEEYLVRDSNSSIYILKISYYIYENKNLGYDNNNYGNTNKLLFEVYLFQPQKGCKHQISCDNPVPCWNKQDIFLCMWMKN